MSKKAIVVFVLTVLGGAGWFFVSPLFIDERVDEAFEFELESGGVDMAAIMAMPENKRLQMKDDIMNVAAAAPDAMATDEMPASSPLVLAQGQFVDADAVHKGSGRATLYGLPGGRHLVRFEDFRTTNGPALVVYLAKHPAPTEASDVTEGGFVKLGKLKGNVGNQNYEVPENTDAAEYHSVVIWCELFGVLFSPASLEDAA